MTIDEINKIHNKTYKKQCAWCDTEFDMYPASSSEWAWKNEMNHKKNWFCTRTCLLNYEKANAKKHIKYEYQKWI